MYVPQLLIVFRVCIALASSKYRAAHWLQNEDLPRVRNAGGHKQLELAVYKFVWADPRLWPGH